MKLTTDSKIVQPFDGLRIAEGVAGTWHYHLTRNPETTRSLCGAQVMQTEIPLSAWGEVGHLREKYCVKCGMAGGLIRPTQVTE